MNHIPSSSAEPQPDWAQALPREAFYEIMLTLRSALPPPLTDTPEDWARRDRAAMAAVGALRPENAAEGRLAAQFVVADAYALDCLRLARERRLEMEVARKCRAQAMSMMREGKSALRLLLRLQTARQAVAEDDTKADQAAWAEHAAVGMMREALTSPAKIVDTRKTSTDDVWKFGMGSFDAKDATESPCETVAGLWPPGREAGAREIAVT